MKVMRKFFENWEELSENLEKKVFVRTLKKFYSNFGKYLTKLGKSKSNPEKIIRLFSENYEKTDGLFCNISGKSGEVLRILRKTFGKILKICTKSWIKMLNPKKNLYMGISTEIATIKWYTLFSSTK